MTVDSPGFESHRSGIVCLLLDPAIHGAGRLVRSTFGSHGVRHLAAMRRAMPDSWVAMVGRVGREPARIVACRPGEAVVAVDTAFAMARHLADTSTWVVNLPDEHQDAVLAMLAERTCHRRVTAMSAIAPIIPRDSR